LLATRGVRVEEYERGDEFLAAVGSRHLDCVLVDLQTPGIKDFELLEVIRQTNPVRPSACVRSVPAAI
jgi:CheY-like chemotaxis protein